MEIYLSRRRSWFRRPRTVDDLAAALNLSDVPEVADELADDGLTVVGASAYRDVRVLVDVGQDRLFEVTDVVVHPAEGDTPATVVLDCVPVNV